MGVNIHPWLLHISPEIRYTRWGRIGISTLSYTQTKISWMSYWESRFKASNGFRLVRPA